MTLITQRLICDFSDFLMSQENIGNGRNGVLSGGEIYLRLLSYSKKYWHLFLLGILGFALYAATQTAFAKLMDYIITAVGKHDESARLMIPVAIMVIFLVRGVGSFLGNYCFSDAARNVIHTLRVEMFSKLLRLPKMTYDGTSSGHLISKFTYDVEQVSGAAVDSLKVVVREGFTVVGLLIFLVYTDWKLSLIFFAITPFIAFVISYASQRFRIVNKRIQNSMGDVTHVASEVIAGQTEVRIYGGDSYENKRFSDVSRYNLRQSMKLVLASSISVPVIQLLIAFSLSVLIWVALGVMGENTTAGEFAAYITAASMLAKPIRQITQIDAAIQRGISACESIFGLLDAEEESDSGVFSIDRVKGAVVFDKVSFAYSTEGKYVLRNVSFVIEPGQTVAIVGRSGSGKSTVINLLLRFYQPQSGQISIDTVPIEQFKLENLRQQFAMVNQRITLFNDTLAHNIAYGKLGEHDEQEIVNAAKAANAWEFIETLPMGLSSHLGENGVNLSGGQRQRIAIARAFLKDAPILILDEATSALDNESERKIQAALDVIMQGRTTIVIAHRLSTIEAADKILVLDEGQIVEEGNHATLLEKNGHYAQLYNIQFANDECGQD